LPKHKKSVGFTGALFVSILRCRVKWPAPSFTLEEIARHANVSKATIYSRVANKGELIEAVIQRESDVTITGGSFERPSHCRSRKL